MWTSENLDSFFLLRIVLQEEQRAYNNREHCRDHFYSIMRKAASTTTAFGWASSGSEDEGYRMMKEAVRQFLQVLLVENYPWFAGEELFLLTLLEYCFRHLWHYCRVACLLSYCMVCGYPLSMV